MQRFTVCNSRAAVLLEKIWYQGHPLKWLLWPLSLLFGLLVAARRLLYRSGVLQSTRLPVPVIIVGNISVGGTGKTPLTIWLVDMLRQQGFQPGIVSRGYGGKSAAYPLPVQADTDPALAGDEPVLLARRCACPVVVDPVRVHAAQRLIQVHDVDVIVSDDGLQHYAMQRDAELVVVDAGRRCGNGMLLPAGPLRETRARLQQVDAVLINGASDDECGFALKAGRPRRLIDDQVLGLEQFAGRKIHAVAGIGNPERFFLTLEKNGLSIERHAFPDHHQFSARELDFGDQSPVLMTEKDAVKCRSFADQHHYYLPVEAVPNARALHHIRQIIQQLPRQS